MNVLTLARRIAHEEGVKPASNALLEYVIEGETPYPLCGTGDEFVAALRRAFRHEGRDE